MSNGPSYRSEMDGLLAQSIARLESTTMDFQLTIEAVKGLVAGAKSSNMSPPFRIVVPNECNLAESYGEENVTLEQHLKDIDGVTEVKKGKTRGVQIESVGDEDCAKKKAGY